jgi:hypothetical protein
MPVHGLAFLFRVRIEFFLSSSKAGVRFYESNNFADNFRYACSWSFFPSCVRLGFFLSSSVGPYPHSRQLKQRQWLPPPLTSLLVLLLYVQQVPAHHYASGGEGGGGPKSDDSKKSLVFFSFLFYAHCPFTAILNILEVDFSLSASCQPPFNETIVCGCTLQEYSVNKQDFICQTVSLQNKAGLKTKTTVNDIS